MWLLIPALAGIGAYVLAQEYPLFGYAVLVVCLGTVIVSVLGSPAAGVSYMMLALLIIFSLVVLRFIIPIVVFALGGCIGLMFFYYLIIGLGQLAGRLP